MVDERIPTQGFSLSKFICWILKVHIILQIVFVLFPQLHHGSIHHILGTGQARTTEKEQTFWQEEKVHQVWGKCYGAEASKESVETEKKEAYWWTMCIWEDGCFQFWPRIH